MATIVQLSLLLVFVCTLADTVLVWHGGRSREWQLWNLPWLAFCGAALGDELAGDQSALSIVLFSLCLISQAYFLVLNFKRQREALS